MAKWQATYRAGAKMPDERLSRLKADVDKYDSFSNFVDALYDSYIAGDFALTDGSSQSVVSVPADNTPVLDAVEEAKRAILAAILDHAAPVPVDVVDDNPSTQPVAVGSVASDASAISADSSPMAVVPTIDISGLLTHEAMKEHKDDILREIMKSHEKELERLDKILETIENLMPSPGESNIMLTAETPAIVSESDDEETLVPVQLMGEEETSRFVDDLVDELEESEEVMTDAVGEASEKPTEDSIDIEDEGDDSAELIGSVEDDEFTLDAIADLIYGGNDFIDDIDEETSDYTALEADASDDEMSEDTALEDEPKEADASDTPEDNENTESEDESDSADNTDEELDDEVESELDDDAISGLLDIWGDDE